MTKVHDRYIGVDVSLTATAMVSLDFFGNVTHITKDLGYPLDEKATVWEQTKRNLVIASGVVPFIANCKYAAIEGYAFSAKSARISQICELGGVIRSKMMHNPKSYPKIIPPSALKKFATGKGRCKGKAPVIMAVYKKWGFEADDCDDNVVDAYVLAQMMRYSHIWKLWTEYKEGLSKEEAEVVTDVMHNRITNYQVKTLMACGLTAKE